MYTLTVCKQVFEQQTNNIQKQKTRIHFKTIERMKNEMKKKNESEANCRSGKYEAFFSFNSN